jgi:hypothetical protein
MVEVKVCSALMKRSMPAFTVSSALTAYEWAKSRVFLIWPASLSVGVGLFGVSLLSLEGFSVIPEAGSGVVAAMVWVEGSV